MKLSLILNLLTIVAYYIGGEKELRSADYTDKQDKNLLR